MKSIPEETKYDKYSPLMANDEKKNDKYIQ